MSGDRVGLGERLPQGVALEQALDHARMRFPRQYRRQPLALVMALGLPGGALFALEPLMELLDAMSSVGLFLATTGLWIALMVLAMAGAMRLLRQQSAPYVEVFITDHLVRLTTLRPAEEITIHRDDILGAHLSREGVRIETRSGEDVVAFPRRSAAESLWICDLFAALARDPGDEQTGQAAIPAALKRLQGLTR